MKLYNVVIEGLDTKDYPDFSDAFIQYAEWEDGTALSEQELNDVPDEIVYELAYKKIYR